MSAFTRRLCENVSTNRVRTGWPADQQTERNADQVEENRCEHKSDRISKRIGGFRQLSPVRVTVEIANTPTMTPATQSGGFTASAIIRPSTAAEAAIRSRPPGGARL
jgi:hypothetical protein